MTTRPQRRPPSAAQDVPNLGLVRPPIVYLISLISGAVIQLATPFPFLPGTLAVPLGAPLVAVAIALFCLLGRDIPGGRHACARSKAHHHDRPGGALSLQPEPDLSGVLPVPARYRDVGQQRVAASDARRGGGAHALLRHTEKEQYLERRFGVQYLDYKASVRRWL